MTFDRKKIPPHAAVTGRIQSWIDNPQGRLGVSCTRFVVEDTMEGFNGIEDSWIFTSYGLRNAQGVAIDLSKLRPNNTRNEDGLVASGPCSFALEYSLKNKILRRGGIYKNGAVNIHLNYRHADIVDFMLMTREELPWAYKTIDVKEDFVDYFMNLTINRTVKYKEINSTGNVIIKEKFYKTALDVLLDQLRSGDMLLSKLIQDADGEWIGSNVCLEVYLRSRGTCLLIHENMGIITPEQFPTAFKELMEYICQLHPETGVSLDGKYLPPNEDRQVGVGVLGLANMLAHEDITYLDFVIALEEITGIDSGNSRKPSERARQVASLIYHGYMEAAGVAKKYKMVRAFVVAPTATCSYKHVDRFGFTTTPEIAPPLSNTVERDSGTFGNDIYVYPTNVEIASQVGYDTFFRLNNAWQKMMNDTGLAHSISTNWWSDQVDMNEALLRRWAESYQRALYYSLTVSNENLDKSKVLYESEVVNPGCDLSSAQDKVCIPCGE